MDTQAPLPNPQARCAVSVHAGGCEVLLVPVQPRRTCRHGEAELVPGALGGQEVEGWVRRADFLLRANSIILGEGTCPEVCPADGRLCLPFPHRRPGSVVHLEGAELSILQLTTNQRLCVKFQFLSRLQHHSTRVRARLLGGCLPLRTMRSVLRTPQTCLPRLSSGPPWPESQTRPQWAGQSTWRPAVWAGHSTWRPSGGRGIAQGGPVVGGAQHKEARRGGAGPMEAHGGLSMYRALPTPGTPLYWAGHSAG